MSKLNWTRDHDRELERHPYRSDLQQRTCGGYGERPGYWLSVPYAERDQAKTLGAKWSSEQRRWYVPHGHAVLGFAKWNPTKCRKGVIP